jgi:hypothetical protein
VHNPKLSLFCFVHFRTRALVQKCKLFFKILSALVDESAHHFISRLLLFGVVEFLCFQYSNMDRRKGPLMGRGGSRRSLLSSATLLCIVAVGILCLLFLVVALPRKGRSDLRNGGKPDVAAVSIAPSPHNQVDIQIKTLPGELGSEDHISVDPQYIEQLQNISAMSDVPMPYKYPMHRTLPIPRNKMILGMFKEHLSISRQSQRCWGPGSAEQPIFQPAPEFLQPTVDQVTSAKLQSEFDFKDDSGETFYREDTHDLLHAPGVQGEHPWWVQSEQGEGALDNGDLPCTAEVQARLFQLQHPNKPCDKVRYLVSKLKEGAHGVGSALTLVAHDLLSSIMVGRVLQLHTSTKWYFSSPHCSDAKHGGWDCFFLPVSSCKASGGVEMVSNRRQAHRSLSPVIVKKSFDIDGLSRNDLPSDENFFGPIQTSTCYAEYKKWIQRPANIYIQGTFERGADPRLFYMLAQATRYLMRAPQPWFRRMLHYHLPQVGISPHVLPTRQQSSRRVVEGSAASQHDAIIYIQERGEIAKFREYYNVFGCHNINNTVFVDYVGRWCHRVEAVGGLDASRGACKVYISGNTPFKNYQQLAATFSSMPGGIEVLSTWKHPSVAKGGETERWGASSPASSWIDMFAGVSSTNWICIVQSNWCRMINLLRLTSGRASCGFIDGGALMIASAIDRERYCIVGPYPTKAFSNRLK